MIPCTRMATKWMLSVVLFIGLSMAAVAVTGGYPIQVDSDLFQPTDSSKSLLTLPSRVISASPALAYALFELPTYVDSAHAASLAAMTSYNGRRGQLARLDFREQGSAGWFDDFKDIFMEDIPRSYAIGMGAWTNLTVANGQIMEGGSGRKYSRSISLCPEKSFSSKSEQGKLLYHVDYGFCIGFVHPSVGSRLLLIEYAIGQEYQSDVRNQPPNTKTGILGISSKRVDTGGASGHDNGAILSVKSTRHGDEVTAAPNSGPVVHGIPYGITRSTLKSRDNKNPADLDIVLVMEECATGAHGNVAQVLSKLQGARRVDVYLVGQSCPHLHDTLQGTVRNWNIPGGSLAVTVIGTPEYYGSTISTAIGFELTSAPIVALLDARISIMSKELLLEDVIVALNQNERAAFLSPANDVVLRNYDGSVSTTSPTHFKGFEPHSPILQHAVPLMSGKFREIQGVTPGMIFFTMDRMHECFPRRSHILDSDFYTIEYSLRQLCYNLATRCSMNGIVLGSAAVSMSYDESRNSQMSSLWEEDENLLYIKLERLMSGQGPPAQYLGEEFGKVFTPSIAHFDAQVSELSDSSRPFKVAAVYNLRMDDADWLNLSITSIYSDVDVIVAFFSTNIWNGVPPVPSTKARDALKAFPDPQKKIHVIEGRWENEKGQRNANLRVVKSMGCTHALVIDSDEVYDPIGLRRLFGVGKTKPRHCIHAKWYTYWKDHRHVIDPLEPFTPIILMNVDDCYFSRGRIVNSNISEDYLTVVPPGIVLCHHLSYARTDEQARRKFEMHPDKRFLAPDWYDRVWLKWTPNMRNLHPTRGAEHSYQVAVQQPFEKLPPTIRMYHANVASEKSDFVPGMLVNSETHFQY